MVSPDTFERLSYPVVEKAEDLTLWALRQLRSITERLVDNPEATIRMMSERRALLIEHEAFVGEAAELMDHDLATSYLRGVEHANARSGGRAPTGAMTSTALLAPDGPSGPVSNRAARILSDYPEHHTMYSVFRAAADSALEATQTPIVRQQEDRVRDIIIQSSDVAYTEAEEFTRREMSQELLREFADEGIEAIRYRNGRTMKLDSYTEMMARSQTKNAFNQANWNRLQQYEIDLVAISVHYPCSDLCEPYQGKVFSISGRSEQYPALSSAIDDGLFHANCKHSSSGYTPGTKSPDTTLTATENEPMYEAQKMQRYNERQIRAWKRREAVALTDSERNKAKAKIREWQARQRDHVKSNEFLRRNYNREQI